jgi:GTPase
MFIDQVTFRVRGGVGGSGAEAFRRESGVPRGGPSGGDGGDGGSVILEADPQLSTLLDYRYRAEYRAERGQHGEGSNRTGRKGEDLILGVPPGTVVRDVEADEILAELLEPGERFVVARGGRGGRGNARFATATRQAPTHWEPGREGEELTLELTLKLIADVGLVGEPNAGKSTLLAAVSAARPRVADYPFTTLSPNLGVVELPDFRSFVVADVPGIIEGAHEGKGLGHQFLRHIERTRTLALLVPVDDPDPGAAYRRLREELARYSDDLARRPHCLLLTKIDLLGPNDALPEVEAPDAWGIFSISAVARRGLDSLLEALWARGREEQVRVREEAPGRRTTLEARTAPGGGTAPDGETTRGAGTSPGAGSDLPSDVDDEEDWWGGGEI